MSNPLPTTRINRRSWILANTRIATQGTGFPAGCTLPQNSVERIVVNLNDTVTYGGDIPDYAKKIARGESATTSLSGVRFQNAWSPFAYEHRNFANRCLWTKAAGAPVNMGFVTSVPSSFPNTSAEMDAVRALARSYESASAAWRGGNFIAEFADTLKMFKNPLQGVWRNTNKFAGRLRRVKRLGASNPKRYGELISDAYLNYQFGIAPLVKDVGEVVDALATMQLLEHYDTTRIIGNGRAMVLDAPDMIGTSIAGGIFAIQNRRSTLEQDVRYTGAIRASPSPMGRYMQHFGVGLADVVPAVWEAIPFSFIIDYFTNCGDLINGLRLVNANVAWLQRTSRIRRQNVGSSARPQHTVPQTYAVSVRGGSWYSRGTRVDRARMSMIPYPTFQFRMPGVDSLQWMNLAALAANFLSSKPPPRV